MITGQFTAIFSAVIIALLLSTIMYADYTYKEVSRKYTRLNENFTLRLENQLQKPVQLLWMLDSALAFESIDQGEYDKIGTMMKIINQTDHLFENIEVVNLKGEILSVFPEYSHLLRFDRSGEDFFRTQPDWSTMHWSDLEVSELSQKISLRVSVRSRDVLLSGVLNMEYIDALCSEFQQENEYLGDVELTDRYGIYLYSNDAKKVDEHQIDPLFNSVNGTHDHHEDSGIKYIDNQWQFISSRHVMESGWHVVIKTPVIKAFRNGLIILGGFLFFILMTILFFGIIARRNTFVFSNHVGQLIHQIHSVSEGKYEKVPEISNYREFHELTHQFNRMLESVKTRDSQLQHIAFRDELTSLSNRNYLFERLIPQLISEPNTRFALIIIDIDNFNVINDTIGHELGDGLLVALSNRLLKHLPADVHVIRLGGDEFALIVPISYERNTEQVLSILNRIQSEPFTCSLRKIYITMSVGVSYYPEQGENISTLMKNADIAMHHAKRSGRGKVHIFNEEMSENVDRKLQLEQYLRTALENNEFHLMYQPQFSMDGKTLRGFEALIRWTHPVLGKVGPSEFIPLAEDAQLIAEIEAWVLKEACLAIKQINTLRNTNYIMAVNVSPIEFLNSTFLQTVKSSIESIRFCPEWLELEITENVSMGIHESVLAQVYSLKELGVKVSMDDFGTGYSSLSYISRFPIDLLKIDRSFISEIHQSTEKQAMVKTIIALVNQLGIQSLAEGVETEEELKTLTQLSCDFVQGYLYGRPMELEKILVLVVDFD